MTQASTAQASAPPEDAALHATAELAENEAVPLSAPGETELSWEATDELRREAPVGLRQEATVGLRRQATVRVVRSIAEIRSLLKPRRRAGARIGFVPTMGALHAGHLSLIAEARRRCDVVVLSIFVNPTQFNEQTDLAAYPRQEEQDVRLAAEAGAEIVFAPSPEEIYRPGFSTYVEVEGLTDRLEGAVRGAQHFRGMCTIVCKLLNIVGPELAFFGQKDAQQAAVVTRMCHDLDLDVEIVALPTIRERDGLAMSSRNVRLDERERARSLALVCALRAAERLACAGERSPRALLSACEAELERWSVQPEYVALVDPESFEDVQTLHDEALLLLAARVGRTRLIDNALLRLGGVAQLADELDVTPQMADASASGNARAAALADHRHDTEAREAIATCSA